MASPKSSDTYFLKHTAHKVEVILADPDLIIGLDGKKNTLI